MAAPKKYPDELRERAAHVCAAEPEDRVVRTSHRDTALLNDFLVAGGKIEVREFHQPNDLLQLPERTLVNATGYGARALFGDNSLIPVRGQTARLIPQPEVRYGISSSKVSMVPRRDGLLVQAFGDSGNFNNPDTTPVRAVSEAAVLALARIVEGMRQPA